MSRNAKFCERCGRPNNTYTEFCESCLEEIEREDNDHPISQDDMTYPEEGKK